jgi:ATP-dependent helicase/nuclease subunit A
VVGAPALREVLAANACLFAGAGAGKTHGLLTAALGLLAGVSRAEPLPPGRLCLLTFTEKAAAEMRQRLAARVEALAEGRGAEPELAQAFTAEGRPLPNPAFWRRVQVGLGTATLSTFHAYCFRLLRQAPPGNGIPAGFELLAEEDAAQLLVDTAEQRVLALLDAGDAGVEALCAQAELRGPGRGRGLLDLIVGAVGRLRDEGGRAAGLAVREAGVAERTLHAAVARAVALLAGVFPLATREAPEVAQALQACLDVLQGVDATASPERLARLEVLAEALPRAGKNGLRDAARAAREALLDGTPECPGVLAAVAGVGAIPHEQTLRRLLDAVEADYRAALRRGGWMDFGELLLAGRNLLRDDVGARASAQARIGALLVDEVQDTNGLQLELVSLLAEARAGAPRPLPAERAAVLALPFEPRLLLAVGDRKQSIYDFRGADVAVFETLARKVEAEGGARHHLRANRRSQPALLRFLNAAASAALPPVAEPRPYEVEFHLEQDGGLPVRPQRGPEGCVDVLPPPTSGRGGARAEEADVLARWLRFLLSPEGPDTVVDGGHLRRARGGEVAILLRAFTGLEAYREALRRHHVPHRVLRDENPYRTPSVLDAAALLGLLADRSDGLALAAVLRSAYVGLSDASLLRLALGGRLEAGALTSPLPSGMPEDEAQRLERFRALFAALAPLAARLPLAELLEAAWSGTGYRAALAAGPDGREGLAALERLSALARRWDAAGRGSAGALSRRLFELSEQRSVGLARGAEEARAGDAVQLLTIHAAKGLQWPVVCLAELATTGVHPRNERLLVERSLGLAWKPQGPLEAEPRRTPQWLQLRDELARRERAEAGRLLYVALTRAEDRLVLSGGGGPVDSWGNRLQPVLDAPELVSVVRRLGPEDVPAGAAETAVPPVAPGDAGPARARLAKLRAAVPVRWAGTCWEAAAVEDFRRCPRRYVLLQTLGLPPAGDGLFADAPWVGELSVRHRAARGRLLCTLAARLESADWQAGVPDAALTPHLAVLGLSLGEARALGLLAPLQALARTRALEAAAHSGALAGGVDMALQLEEAQLRVRATLVWPVEGRLEVLLLRPGAPPALGLEAYAVTTSVVLHALAPHGPARVGVAFADGLDVEPLWLAAPPLSRSALALEVEALLRAGPKLPQARPPERCEALGCGFRARCHPGFQGSRAA